MILLILICLFSILTIICISILEGRDNNDL